MKFVEAIQTYLRWKSTYTKRAYQTYEINLRRLGEYVNKDLELLTEEDITGFHLDFKNKHASAYVSQAIIVIKDFVKFWNKKKILDLDPYFIKAPRYITNPHQVIKFEEYERLCDTLSETNFNDLQRKLAFKLLWWTGMRVSELCNLNISQVDTQKREIIIQALKSNKLRLITWDQQTHELLCRYLGIRICLNQEPGLFVASNGKARERITPRSVQRWVKDACSAAGIKRKLSPHSFRHGLIHYMSSQGLDSEIIQKYIGHTDANSTRKNYMVWDLAELRNMRERVDSVMKLNDQHA